MYVHTHIIHITFSKIYQFQLTNITDDHNQKSTQNMQETCQKAFE